MDEPAFAVLKFAREDDKSDEEEINYEIALTKWLTDIDDQMKDFTYWPPSDQDAGNFVRKEKSVDRSWPKYPIEVLRYYDLYIKARAAVKGFVTEGSAYETEKETGKGKRKKVRNRLFEDTDSDEEIVKRSKKSVPAPPNIPFKRVPVRKDIIQKPENELNNRLFPMTSIPLSKVCSKSNVFEKLKRTREMNNNTSVSHTMLIAHESNYSSDRKSFRKDKVQSPIKETSLVTAESILPQSCVSSLDVDEENFAYGEQNDTPNKKRQCRDIMQHVPSSSVVFHGSPAQTRRFSPLKSGFHQRILFTSPAKNSSENLDVDKISKVAKLCERIYVRLEEINKKTDTIIMNQGRLNRSLLPNEKRLQKPINLPALPVKTEDQLNLLETFLEDENNFAAVCDYFSSFVTSKDVAKSTVKIAVKVLTNSMASTMSFKGQNTKQPFYKLKIWEAIQGSLLIKFDDTALFEAEETMKTWLANAPWRKQDNETYGKRCVKRKLEVNTAK